MESRIFKDIVAFKFGDQTPLAFHGKNMELAEVSEDLWEALNPRSLEINSLEIIKDLELWNSETTDLPPVRSLATGVRSLTVNVAQICNLSCNYCAAGGDGSYGSKTKSLDVAKALPQLKLITQRLNSGDHFNITFLGGEPLLYPTGIKEIADYAQLIVAGKNIDLTFSIVTNGTLLTESNVQLLANIKAHLTISMDGPTEINDIVRPRKDGKSTTAAILEGLKNLTSFRDQLSSVGVHGVFDSNNLNLVEAYDFYSSLDFDRYTFTFSVEETSPEASRQFVEKMELVAAKAFHKGGEIELRKIDQFNKHFKILDEQIRIENHCGIRKNLAVMDTQARIYTCPWMVGLKDQELELNNLSGDSGLNSAPLLEQNNCQTCWARHLCGGGCLYIHKKATGSLSKKSDTFCERTQSLIALSFLYYKKARIGVTP